MTENKNAKTTTEENKKAIEAIVKTAEKAPAKKAPAKKAPATASAKKPVAKTGPVKQRQIKSTAAAKAEPATKLELAKAEQKKPDKLTASLSILPTLKGKAEELAAARKCIIESDSKVYATISAVLTDAEKPLFLAIYNTVRQEKAAKKAADAKAKDAALTKEQKERARVGALCAVLLESLKGAKVIARKEMKAGDVIQFGNVFFVLNGAKTKDSLYCSYYEMIAEDNAVPRFIEEYAIDNKPFPEGTKILRPAVKGTPKAPAVAAK